MQDDLAVLLEIRQCDGGGAVVEWTAALPTGILYVGTLRLINVAATLVTQN